MKVTTDCVRVVADDNERYYHSDYDIVCEADGASLGRLLGHSNGEYG